MKLCTIFRNIFFIKIFIYYSQNFYIFFSSSASPESGLGTSHTSLPGSGQDCTTEQHIQDDLYDVEPLQPLGTCKALYPFDGKKFKQQIQCTQIIE